ncbi:MAG: hypothetical protein NUV47_00325 [Patescibacteria group bacterium]|nr:hypothetical protein [Patescibacteria group bacterium]
MKKIHQIGIITVVLLILWVSPVSAHRSPDDCSGSGLGINLSTNSPQAYIGDIISYSLDIFNGTGIGPVVCDATDIQASITTPDGQNHSVSLTRTSLSNGQLDFYSNIVTYVARTEDVKTDGTLTATADNIGTIHQNDTDSQGGGNQGVNVTIITSPVVIPPPPTPPSSPPTLNSSGSRHHPLYTPPPVITVTVASVTPPTIIPLPSFPITGRTIDIYGIINGILIVILIVCLGKLYFV